MSKRGSRVKKWRLKRGKASRGENPEKSWGKIGGSKIFRNWLIAGVIVLLGWGIWGLPSLLPPEEGVVRQPAPQRGEKSAWDEVTVREKLAAAAKMARQFVGSSALEERLRWVRDGEEVRGRVVEYSVEARETVGKVAREMGYSVVEGQGRTGFVIALPRERFRLLELVEGEAGWKVDWDAYARYGTASWEDLLAGKSERAVVRVFVSPGLEYPPPFEDEERWTGFQLRSPDLEQTVLGFARKGSVREEHMKAVILSTPRYRQQMTLEITRREGEEEALFEIERCHAIGWVLGERPVEEAWR